MSRRTRRRRAEASYGPQTGTTYLLHFIDPATGEPARYKHAGHYIGWTTDLAARLEAHARGEGARLVEVISRAGLGFTLARTWPATTRDREDLLKHVGDARRFCPECGVKPRQEPAVQVPERRRSLHELERDGTWLDGMPLPQSTTCPAPAAALHTAASREENQMFGRERRAAARQEAEQQAEAGRLFALADELGKQAGERPDYRREITAERAARIRRELGKDLATDAAAQASEPRLHGAELDAEIDRLAGQFPQTEPEPLPATQAPGAEPGIDAARWDPQQAGDSPLTGDKLDREIDRLAGMFPEPEPPGAGPSPARDRAGEPAPDYYRSAPGSAEHREAYGQMFADADGIGFADPDVDRSYEIDNADELARERYYEELAERHYAQLEGREPYGRYEPDWIPQPDGATPAAWDRYVTSQPGSDEHKAACADMHREANGEGFPGPDPNQSYLADHGYETDADRFRMPDGEETYAVGDREAAEDGAEPADAWLPADAEPGEDAASWGPELDAPDHLYGAPECTEADPETDHFGQVAAEPEDAGRFPLPRVLDPADPGPALAPVAATLPDGTPHADSFLAERGWEAHGGMYVRHPQAQLEAG